MRYVWLDLRHRTRVLRIATCVIYSPIAYVWGLVQVFLFILCAEMLAFMAILVVAAVVLNFVALPLARLFAELGARTLHRRSAWDGAIASGRAYCAARAEATSPAAAIATTAFATSCAASVGNA